MKELSEIANKSKKRIVGLMSGTSADGVDAALIELDNSGVSIQLKLFSFHFLPYPDEIRERIFELFSPETGSVDKICQMNFLLGRLFAEATVSVIDKAGLSPEDISLVGSHGQTICHMPPSSGAKVPSTLQIGEPSIIAQMTGIPVVADFRVADVAVGGEGAPLVPYVDFLLFKDEKQTRTLQNIGGISNVTVIPAKATIDDVLAFDTGPGNMLMDAVVQLLTSGKYSFDPDGSMAAKGKTDKLLLSELMSHPFISASPPKTTGREDFGVHFAKNILSEAKTRDIKYFDIIATLTDFTAKSIYENYRRFVLPQHNVSEVIISGGGTQNLTLLNHLQRYFGDISIVKIDKYGIPSEAKEAVAFAVLANETVTGQTGNVPNVTGASRSVVLGKIIPVNRVLH